MENEKPKRPRGRPKKELNLSRIKEMAQAGATDEQIANATGVVRSTLHRQRKNDKGLSNIIHDWKLEADNQVEKSLYQRAMGIMAVDGKYYPPDPTSMIFWLKNRRHKDWRDKQEVELSGSISNLLQEARNRTNIPIEDTSPEQSLLNE